MEQENRRSWQGVGLVLALLMVTGCASNVPMAIRSDVAHPIRIEQVRASPDRFVDVPVRWGGDIIAVENKERSTWVEVLGRTLQSDGRPKLDAVPEGRFLAVVPGFLDPAVYASGREFTVTGRVASLVVRKVGDFPYSYPLVETQAHHLWPPRQEVRDPWDDPFYYDPWYPWYWDPYYRYPYYRHPRYPYPWW